MFDKAKKYFKPALYIVGAVFWFLAVYSLYPALATYAPGETLDPPCSPGDAGCSVNAPLVTTLTTSTDMVMATYTLSFDTSTFYIDPVNDRVAVNTTTPLATFDVDGNMILSAASAYLNFNTTTGSGGYGIRDNDGTIQYRDGGGTWAAFSASTGTVNDGTLGSLAYYPANGTTVTGTTAAFLYWDDTNVRLGIGTTTPLATLHSESVTEQLRLGYDAANYASFIIDSAGSLTVSTSGGVVQIGDGGATNHALATNDDLVVTGQFEAIGSSFFEGDLTIANDLFIGGNVEVTGTIQVIDNFLVGGTSFAVDTESDRVGINTITPSAMLDIVSTTEQLRLAYDPSNYTSFTIGSDGALTVTSTNNVTTTINNSFIVGSNKLVVDYNSGQVGIGIANPAVGLHVGANATTHGSISTDDAIITGVLEVDGFAYFDNDLYVNTNTLYVDTFSGRIGFNTSTPAATMHAVSTTEQLRLGYDESNWVSFTVGSDGALAVTSTNNVTTTYNTSFIVNGGGPDILVVDYNSSKVGIGNSAPAVGLHVGNTGTKHGLTLGNDAIFSSNVEVSGIVYIESDLLVNTNTLYVDTTSDRVGFGTSSPAATMHAVSTTEQLRLGYNENNYTSFTVGSDGALTITSTNNVTTTINNSFIAQGALTNVLVVDTNSGNVGIANEVPVVSLHVGGNATTHGLSGGGVIVSGALEVDGVSYFDDNVEISASLGVGTSTPSTTLQVLSTDTTQFTLAYDTTNFVNFNVSSTGALTIETMGSATTTFTNAVDISELYSGLITLPEDGGIVDVMDMPISTTPTGTAEAYNFLMDGLQVMSIWGQSDGTGQPSNTGITIGTTTIVTSSYKLFVAGSASTSAAIGVEGYVKATGFLTGSTSLDLAESYPIDPNCNETGSCPLADDVVCSVEKPNKTFVIEKCDVENADNVIGVVSRKPGFGLGRYNPMVYNPDESGLYPTEYLMIGLAGRVSVKVSTANGAIKSGDLLTSSAEAGVAVKSRGAGRVIGVALQSYGEAENGVIIVFINPHWAPGQMFEGMDQTDNDGVLDKFTIVVRNSLGKLGLVIKNGVALIKEIRTNKLCVGDTCVTETEFRRMLENSETLPAAPTTPGQSTEDTKIPDTNVDENDETSTTTDTEEDTTQEDSTTSASSTDEEANSESTESETQTTATEESSEVNESTDATETANTTVETATDTESTTETVETATVETVVTEPVVEEAVAIEESVVVEVVESTTATSNENVQ